MLLFPLIFTQLTSGIVFFLQKIRPIRKIEDGKPVYRIPLDKLDQQEPNQVFIITANIDPGREAVTPLVVELKECVEGG